MRWTWTKHLPTHFNRLGIGFVSMATLNRSFFHTSTPRPFNWNSFIPKFVVLKLFPAQYDDTFTEDTFLSGAKSQIGYVSSLLSSGDVEPLKSMFEPLEYERICRRLSLLDEGTKEWLKIDVDDIKSARMHSLIIMTDTLFEKPHSVYMTIPVTIIGYHTRYDSTPPDGSKAVSQFQKNFLCTYHFTKRLMPEFYAEEIWQIRKLCHKKNFLITAI